MATRRCTRMPASLAAANFMVTSVQRSIIHRGRSSNSWDFFGPKIASSIPRKSANFRKLAIQLSLDHAVRSLRYVESLPASQCSVRVDMLVADRESGAFAFDMVEERPLRDVDAEGLLFPALERHGIGLIEVDGRSINAEPKSSTCLRIWESRGRRVGAQTIAVIQAALGENGGALWRGMAGPAGARLRPDPGGGPG
jgi:hypothetical protein